MSKPITPVGAPITLWSSQPCSDAAASELFSIHDNTPVRQRHSVDGAEGWTTLHQVGLYRWTSPRRKESPMGMDDKLENLKDQAVGSAKESVGEMRGDDQQQAEGQLQESKGDLKQAGEKIKDALS